VTAIEGELLLTIQNHLRVGVLDAIMLLFSFIGNLGAVWLVAAFILLARRDTRRRGFAVLLSLTVTFLVVNLLLKNVVARPRPFETIAGLTVLGGFPSGFSFPSGHASSSFAGASALAFGFGKRGAIAAYVVAALIAASRVYIGVHYPSDVLAGAVIGVICAVVVCRFMLRRSVAK
jgi:undecaprenyl-diphosphatase